MEDKEKSIISTKKVDESKEKRKPGALINVRVSALHSKGNKAELYWRYGVNHSSKRANGKVVHAIMIRSSGGINRCHLICEFKEGENDTRRHTIHVGQVNYGHVDVDPYDHPCYHPSSAAAAAELIPPLPGLSDTLLETQEMPQPPPAGASPVAASPVAAAAASPAAAANEYYWC